MDEEVKTSDKPSVESTKTEEEVKKPEVVTPDFQAELAKLRAESEQRLKESERRFKQMADQQTARFQSVADKERQLRQELEAKLEAIEDERLDGLDPEDIKQEIKRIRKEQRELKRGSSQPVVSPNLPQSTFSEGVNATMFGLLETLGIDKKDSRLDWGDENLTFSEGLRRFNASVTKIQQEELNKKTQVEVDKIKKATRLEVEREHEVGAFAKVETRGTSTLSETDNEFLARYAKGEFYNDKAADKKAKQILDKMQRGG